MLYMFEILLISILQLVYLLYTGMPHFIISMKQKKPLQPLPNDRHARI